MGRLNLPQQKKGDICPMIKNVKIEINDEKILLIYADGRREIYNRDFYTLADVLRLV